MIPVIPVKRLFSKTVTYSTSVRTRLDLYPSNVFLDASQRENLLGQPIVKKDELQWRCHIIRIPEILAANVSSEKIHTVLEAVVAAETMVDTRESREIATLFFKKNNMYQLGSKGWLDLQPDFAHRIGDKIEIYLLGKIPHALNLLALFIIAGRIPDAPAPIAHDLETLEVRPVRRRASLTWSDDVPDLEQQPLSSAVAALEEEVEALKRENQCLKETMLENQEIKFVSFDEWCCSLEERGSSKPLRYIMFDMDDWVRAFSNIVFSGYQDDLPPVLKELINTDPTIKRMSMFYLPTPFVERHKFYFLRCLKEIETDVWVIVDVSGEYFGLNRNISSEEKCRRRPSGLIIRGGHERCSEVVWVENMECCGSHLRNRMYSDIVNLNGAFSADHWVSTLKWWLNRNSHKFINPADQIHDKRVDASLLRLTASTKKAYIGFTTGGPPVIWKLLSPGDINIWEHTMATNRYVAVTSFSIGANPISVYNFLESRNTRLQWQSSLNFREGDKLLASDLEDPDDHITVYRKQLLLRESDKEFESLILEGAHDGFCYYVLSNFLTHQEANGLIRHGVCSDEELQPSGFAVVPDGSNGSLITIVTHQVVDTPETSKAIESMEALLLRIIGESA